MLAGHFGRLQGLCGPPGRTGMEGSATWDGRNAHWHRCAEYCGRSDVPCCGILRKGVIYLLR